MFRSLRKAASSLEKSMETAFSSPPSTHTAFIGTTLTISGIKLKLGPVFAEGGYSFIHNAKPVSSACTTTRYAVKRISCADPDTEKQTHHEIDFLRQLPPHPNIVRFYDAVFQDNHAFLLFELVDGGTLAERLNSSSPDARRRLSIFADAVAAVTHLHAQNPPVVIRDVKLENLLYDRLEQRYKLCDFGSVTTTTGRLSTRKEILAAEEEIASSCTAMYRAPELVDLYSKHFICEQVDVWALGCVWYAILFGTLPFDGQSSLQISKGIQNIPADPKYPDEFISLLKGMLAVDPADRLDAFAVSEAVTGMLGREFDPALQGIGLKLRQKRRVDFGGSGEQPSIACPSNLFTKQRNSLAKKPPIPQPPADTAHRINQVPSLVQISAPSQRTVESKAQVEQVGWADFDSAFGGPSSTSTKAGGSQTDFGGNLGAYQERNSSNSGERSSGGDPLAPLVDFSDLHVTPQRAGRGSSSTLTKKPAVSAVKHDQPSAEQLKRGTGRPCSDFGDLIDFG